MSRFEPDTAFLSRYFDIAACEYEAAAPRVTSILEVMEGPIRILDVGCGHGHLMSLVLAKLNPNIAARITIDYLDPQVTSLQKYAEKIPQKHRGFAIQSLWEQFYPERCKQKYDVIIVFQSLWSYPLVEAKEKISGLSERLNPKGTCLIGHSVSESAYFSLLENLGPQLHPTLPKLNRAETILQTIKDQNLIVQEERVSIIQTIEASDKESLFIYLAAALYLSSAVPVREAWKHLEPQLISYRDDQGNYQFSQAISFMKLSPGRIKE